LRGGTRTPEISSQLRAFAAIFSDVGGEAANATEDPLE
jgi:hypothetical protein